LVSTRSWSVPVSNRVGSLTLMDPLDGAVRSQSGDLVGGVAKLGEDGLTVRARVRRRRTHGRRGARDADRVAHEVELAQPGMADGGGEVERALLLVGEDLVHQVDRTARYAGVVEQPDPLVRRTGAQPFADDPVELGAMGEAVGGRAEARIGRQV